MHHRRLFLSEVRCPWRRSQARELERCQQHLGIHEIRSIEAFREPVVDFREALTGRRILALALPEARKTHHCA